MEICGQEDRGRAGAFQSIVYFAFGNYKKKERAVSRPTHILIFS